MPTSRHVIDQDYLLDLIKDFPYDAENPIDVIKARQKIQLRHNQLSWENKRSPLALFPQDKFFDELKRLPRLIHHVLYQEILCNAGKYRSATEPQGGIVRFGPNRQYQGTHPDYIEEKIDSALSLLKRNAQDPIFCALTFYQQFVYIHPFYDANGRIGRCIVSLYLHYHGYIVDWEDLEKNNKWLKTLNNCYDRMNATQDVYQDYLARMVRHWSKSIHSFSKDEE